MKTMIYIHVPFCRHKCSYCDFVSGTNVNLKERYIDAMRRELELRRARGVAETLYMGGGTPSMLSVAEIGRIRDIVAERYDLSQVAEWTVECNPEDMTEEWLCGIRDAGVSRLSVGVQSLDEGQLRWMERRHTAEEAVAAVRRAREVGFGNISCDMIFGLPGEGLSRTIKGLLELDVEHVSAYQLMMEEGSKITKKGMEGAGEEESIEMYRTICEALRGAGYEHYEVSNWARTGYRSRHNTGYWTGLPYIGLGPAAHSFDGVDKRQWNVGNTMKYCKMVESGEECWASESLSSEERFNEMVMLGLRMCEGVELRRMRERFGDEATDGFVKAMRRFEGKVVVDDERVRLTEEGVFVSDMIMAEGMM